MRWFSFSVLLYVSVFIISCENSQYNSIKLRNIICSPVEEFITNTTCTIKAIGREKFLLNMDSYVVKPLKNITVISKLYKFYNGYRFLQKFTFNVCDVLSKKKFHPVSNIAISLGLKFSNVVHSCPFLGHICIRNASYTPELLTPFLSSGKFKVQFNVFEGYPLVSIGTVEGSLDVEELHTKH